MFLPWNSFKQRDIQVQAQFRFSFPQRPPASEIAFQKNVSKYQKDVTCLNLNKTRSA